MHAVKSPGQLPTAKTRELRGHRDKVLTVDWSCDGKRLASGSSDTTARIFSSIERTSRAESVELRGHTESVYQLAWDPTDPERLATASTDRTVRVWDTRSGKSAHTLNLSGANLNICWSPDGRHVAVSNNRNVLTFIDMRKMAVIKTWPSPVEVNEISWNKKGDLFFLTTSLGTVIVLDYPTLDELLTIQAHTANCFCIDFDNQGRYFAVGSADALVSLWDLHEFSCQRTFGELEWGVRTLSFSYDSALIASGSEDQFIDISYVNSGQSLYHVPCAAAVNAVVWHPSQYLLAYAVEEQDRSRKTFEGNVHVLGFAPDS